MRQLLKYSVLALALAAVSPIEVQARNSFDEILDQIMSTNPAQKAADLATESQIAELRSSNNLPDPEVEVDYRWGPTAIQNKLDVGVTQSFDWPGVYQSRGNAVKLESEAMRQLRRSEYLDRRQEGRLLLIDIVNLNRRYALIGRRMAMMDSLVARYTSGPASDELTRLDLAKAKIERVRVAQELSDVEASLAAAKASLVDFSGDESGADAMMAQLTEYPDLMLLPAEEYMARVENNNPWMRAQSFKAQAAAKYAQAERRSRYPGMSFGYRFGREDGINFYGFAVGVTLPVFSTRHKVKAADLMTQSLQAESAAMAIEQRATIGALRQKAAKLLSRCDEMRSILTASDSQRLLRMALEGGEMSLVVYLTEVDYYLQAELECIDLDYQYNQTLAQLDKYAD